MSIRRIISSFRTPPLLDLYPMPVGAAWSLRKIHSAYTGSCIQVRRSSDNALIDIGFTGGEINKALLLAFAGTGNAYVKILYDQSGNGQHLIQADGSRQPQIVNSGNIITENDRPAIRFDGSNDYLEVPASNAYFKALHCDKALVGVVGRIGYSNDMDTACGFVDTGGGLNSQTGYTLFYDDRNIFNRNNAIINIASNSDVSPLGQYPQNFYTLQKQNLIINFLYVNSSTPINRGILKINSNAQINNNNNNTTPSTANSTRTLKIGVVHTLNLINYYLGTMQEIVIYLNDQFQNINYIRSNINSYYNIY